MKVKLTKGRALYDPEIDPPVLCPEDEPFTVPNNQFWQRRIRDGDVELIEPDKPSAEPQERPRHSAAAPPPETPTRPSGERQRGA